MSSSNSTVALLHLWHLCAKSQGGEIGGVLQWTTLRRALDGLPITRCEALRWGTVDDILRRHFGWDQHSVHVNFARYWRGMEAMLQACGSHQTGGLDVLVQQKVASLRNFRDLLLDEPPGVAQSAQLTVGEIRRLFDRLRNAAQRGGVMSVVAYWMDRVRALPADAQTKVTRDEVASALHSWLKELLNQMDGEDTGDSESTSSSAPSVLDEPEHEQTPMGLLNRAPSGLREAGSIAGSIGRASGASVRPETPSGPGRGLQLPPPPRRLVGAAGANADRGSPTGTSEAGSARGAGPSWLLAGAGGGSELPEAEHFRECLVRRLASGSPRQPGGNQGVSIFQFFRAVREAVEDPALALPLGALTPGIVAGAVTSLEGVVHRQLRSAFRQLQDFSRRAAERGPGPLLRLGGPDDIIAGVLCSQARAAEVLERRVVQVAPAWRIAIKLASARRERLYFGLQRWRES